MSDPATAAPAPREEPPSHFWGWVTLWFSVVSWALPPVLSRYFGRYFTAVEQNFFRYVFAVAFLWLFVFLFLRPALRAARIHGGGLLLATALNVGYQLAWVTAVYFIMPTLMLLITKLNVVAGAVVAYAFEPSERETVRSRRFLLGAGLSLLGAAGLVAGGKGAVLGAASGGDGWRAYAFGVGLAVLAAAAWPSYSLCLKRMAGKAHPFVLFAYIATATTFVLMLLTAWRGDLRAFFAAPPAAMLLVAASGVVCMGVSHALFMVALRQLGVAICMLGLLLSPLFTYVVSRFAFGESLSPLQWASVVPLLAGCALAIVRQKPAAAAATAPPAIPVEKG